MLGRELCPHTDESLDVNPKAFLLCCYKSLWSIFIWKVFCSSKDMSALEVLQTEFVHLWNGFASVRLFCAFAIPICPWRKKDLQLQKCSAHLQRCFLSSKLFSENSTHTPARVFSVQERAQIYTHKFMLQSQTLETTINSADWPTSKKNHLSVLPLRNNWLLYLVLSMWQKGPLF